MRQGQGLAWLSWGRSVPLDIAPAQALNRLTVLEGMASPAREAFPSNPFVIDRLPFRIGR